MKKLLLPLFAVLTLAVAAAPATPVSTATVTVKITRTAFVPSKVTIKTGDSVTWKNTDTHNHQVVANNGAFVSRILGPGQSYTFRFRASGTYHYHDGLNPAIRGTVVVTGPPPAVSIAASLPIIIFGQQIHLTGVVSSHDANERVTIYAQPYPQASFSQVTTVLTTAGGAWDYIVAPQILTIYQAKLKSSTSTNVQIGVQPQITFKHSRSYYSTRVFAQTSHAHHWVYVQRLSRFGQWVAIRKVTLGNNSGRVFRLRHLRRGVSRLRIYMTVNQAGLGYLAGYSPVLKVRRR